VDNPPYGIQRAVEVKNGLDSMWHNHIFWQDCFFKLTPGESSPGAVPIPLGLCPEVKNVS
jgi:hypothetical protein